MNYLDLYQQGPMGISSGLFSILIVSQLLMTFLPAALSVVFCIFEEKRDTEIMKTNRRTPSRVDEKRTVSHKRVA